MTNEQMQELAASMAAQANNCCHRTDGWEEALAEQFYTMLYRALAER